MSTNLLGTDRGTGRLARLVFDTMGTVVSVTTARPLPAEVADGVREEFSSRDELFSLYRPGSQGARLARRELRLRDADPQIRDAYWLSHDWEMATDGAFTATRPDGTTDLAGVVKALAIEGAGRVLDDAGIADWCLNAGGDVLVRGVDPSREFPWVAGIVDPIDRMKLVSQATCRPGRRAVATSGTAERGEHVWRLDPGTSSAGTAFTQVTVVADEIITADVLATAILAGGSPTLLLAASRWQVDVLAFDRTGQAWATKAFRAGAADQA